MTPQSQLDRLREQIAQALFEDWVREDFQQTYISWELLPDKDTWNRRAQAVLDGTALPELLDEVARLRAALQAIDDSYDGSNEGGRQARLAYEALHPKQERDG